MWVEKERTPGPTPPSGRAIDITFGCFFCVFVISAVVIDEYVFRVLSLNSFVIRVALDDDQCKDPDTCKKTFTSDPLLLLFWV